MGCNHLDIALEERLYTLLRQSGVTFISVGHRPSVVRFHDAILELTGDGAWRILPVTKEFLISLRHAGTDDKRD